MTSQSTAAWGGCAGVPRSHSKGQDEALDLQLCSDAGSVCIGLELTFMARKSPVSHRDLLLGLH